MQKLIYDLSEEQPPRLKLETGGKYTITVTKSPGGVRTVLLTGLIFDANKSFLLPYALPGIKAIVDMHRKHTQSKLLIIGHDGSDEDFGGVEIAYCRAQIIAQYLSNDVEAWTQWFKADKPKLVRWGTREVQLMLSCLPENDTPFFLGTASGVRNQRTIQAVTDFQKYYNTSMNGSLKVDGKPGPNTQKALIEAYMRLEDTSMAPDCVVTTHGCEGKFEEDLPVHGLQQDERVLEVLFFDNEIRPQPQKNTSRDGDDEYFVWKKKVLETKSFEFHGIHIQIIDKNKKPVAGGRVFLEGPTSQVGHTDDEGFAFFSNLLPGQYTVNAVKANRQISSSTITYPTAKTFKKKK